MKNISKLKIHSFAAVLLLLIVGCDFGTKNLGGPVLISQGPSPKHGLLGVGFEQTLPRVVFVFPNSPAARSGLMAGDTIIALDERTIKDAAELKTELENTKPGEIVRLGIKRGETTLEVEIRLMSVLEMAELDLQENASRRD